MTKYLTEETVAKMLDCSKKTVANMCRSGQLPYIKIGNERRIPEDQLAASLEAQAAKNCSDSNVSQGVGSRTIGKWSIVKTAESKG